MDTGLLRDAIQVDHSAMSKAFSRRAGLRRGFSNSAFFHSDAQKRSDTQTSKRTSLPNIFWTVNG
ncbi:hypothetical protein NHQ30_005169 [Ciborinia camelliae]|nr:hypothetical protein NHQ30_005169 [Ciborinia camelliae]